MTGAQLKKLRQVNGLSERQLGRMLGLSERGRVRGSGQPRQVNIAKTILKLESAEFVPESMVIRINEMITDGKLKRGHRVQPAGRIERVGAED